MSKLKNSIIAAIVVAMTAQIKAKDATPEQKETLQGYLDQLEKLDTEFAIVVAASDAKDVTIQALQEKFDAGEVQIVNLTNRLKGYDQINLDLTEKLAAANEILQGPSPVEGLKNQIFELNQQLVEAGEVISDYAGQLAAALEKAADVSGLPVGELDGVKYQVKSGALGIGTAEEIAADPKKIAKLLTIRGQSVVEPLISA